MPLDCKSNGAGDVEHTAKDKNINHIAGIATVVGAKKTIIGMAIGLGIYFGYLKRNNGIENNFKDQYRFPQRI